jgi:hypothetical protein
MWHEGVDLLEKWVGALGVTYSVGPFRLFGTVVHNLARITAQQVNSVW